MFMRSKNSKSKLISLLHYHVFMYYLIDLILSVRGYSKVVNYYLIDLSFGP